MPSCVASSSITLLNFVSLCVVRSGKTPCACRSTSREVIGLRRKAKSISARASLARLATSASMAFSKAAKRLGVLWKSGIVSCNRGARQVGQQALEPPEGLGRLVGLLRRFHGVVGPGVLDEDVSPPAVALGIDVEHPPVAGRHQREGPPRDVGLAGQLGAEVFGHALDIFHQPHGVLEDVLVDPLMNVTDCRSALAIGGGIGIVDMPGAVGLGVLEVGENLEIPR